MKRFLITGFTGQVGSQLADYILKNTDFSIIGMMRWQEPLDNIYHLTERINKKNRVEIYYADLNDYSSLFLEVFYLEPSEEPQILTPLYFLYLFSSPSFIFLSLLHTAPNSLLKIFIILEQAFGP